MATGTFPLIAAFCAIFRASEVLPIAGRAAIIITSATLLTKKDKDLLKSINSAPSGQVGRGVVYHMFPDRDAPGERLFLQLREVLPGLVHHQLPQGCKDFSDYYLQMQNRI